MAVRYVLVLLVACGGSKPEPTCQEAADQTAAALSVMKVPGETDAKLRRSMHDMVLVRCLRDEWTVEARTCYGAAKSRADVRGCRDKLSSTQVRMMEKDLEEVGRETAPPAVVEKAPPTPIDRPPPKLVIRLFSDGSVQIDGRAIPDDDLDRMLTGAYMREKNTDVIIQTEPDVAHGTVVKLMERAKAAGLTRLAIGTGSGGQP